MTEAVSTTPPVSSEDRTLAIVVYALLMAGMVTGGVTSIVAVVLAYVRKDGAPPLEQSHYRWQIVSFWIGFAGSVLGIVLFFGTFIGMFALAGHFPIPAKDAPAAEPPPPEFFWMFAPMMAAWVVILASHTWGLIRAIYGLVQLNARRPVGRRLRTAVA